MKRDHLAALESESIYVLRETFNKFPDVAMLWSIGKDSTVLLWLARKAFLGHVPFPVRSRGHDLQDPVDDRVSRSAGARVEAANWSWARTRRSLAGGVTFPNGRSHSRRMLRHSKKDALKAVLEHGNYTGVIVGVRRDEEPTRAKERYFSPRNKNMEWNVRRTSRRNCGSQFKTDFSPGTHIRIHPLLHWTELNIWEYIEREGIPVIPLYFDEWHRRIAIVGWAAHRVQRRLPRQRKPCHRL